MQALILLLYLIPLLGALYLFIHKNSPLYFKLLFFAAACFFLDILYQFVQEICMGGQVAAFSFSAFASTAGFLFMLSANYGQFDSFVDDKSPAFKNARIIAVLAPLALAGLFIATTKSHIILNMICKLPACFAAYFHLKHLILKDDIHFLVDSLRPYNLMCLIFTVFYFLSDTVYVAKICMAICLSLMVITAERGRRKWKI